MNSMIDAYKAVGCNMPNVEKQDMPKLYIGDVEIEDISLDNIHIENEPNEYCIASFRVLHKKAQNEVFLDLSENVLKGTIEDDSITSLNIEIKYNEHKVLTFYVNGEPNGIVIYSKMNIVDSKPVYPFEFEILHNKGHFVFLKYSPDKLTVCSTQNRGI